MDWKLSITGDKQLDKALRDLEPKFRRKVANQAMRNGMKTIRQDVQQNVPVKTGTLKRSVKLKAGKKSRRSFGIDVRIETPTVQYAPAVELGTQHQTAQHPMKMTYDNKGQQVVEQVTKECWSGIQKIARQGGQ